MQQFTIELVGQPNLVFEGEQIGQSEGPAPRIKIYRTKAGHYVGEIKQGGVRSDACHYDTPEQVVNWFKGQPSSCGQVTPDVQAAIEAATTKDDQFKKYWTVQID
jgi:hypothetical protein